MTEVRRGDDDDDRDDELWEPTIVASVGRPLDDVSDVDRSTFAAIDRQQVEAYGLVARGLKHAPARTKLALLFLCLAPCLLAALVVLVQVLLS